jgi:hypothetical protein
MQRHEGNAELKHHETDSSKDDLVSAGSEEQEAPELKGIIIP